MADCNDEDPAGCANLELILNGQVAATGVNHLDADVALPNYRGTTVTWNVVGTDRSGHPTSSAPESIGTICNPGFEEKLSVLGARITAFDGTRWVAFDRAGHAAYLGASGWTDTAPQCSSFDDAQRTLTQASLTPGGALLADLRHCLVMGSSGAEERDEARTRVAPRREVRSILFEQ